MGTKGRGASERDKESVRERKRRAVDRYTKRKKERERMEDGRDKTEKENKRKKRKVGEVKHSISMW